MIDSFRTHHGGDEESPDHGTEPPPQPVMETLENGLGLVTQLGGRLVRDVA